MDKDNIPKYQDTVKAIWRLEKVILDTLHMEDVVQKTVDSVFSELGFLKLGYKIIVLSLVDEEKKVLRRVAISQTEEAKKAISESPMPFKEIAIPLSSRTNICIEVLKKNETRITHKWSDVLSPPIDPETVNATQKKIGIKTSLVFPVNVKGKTIGTMIFSLSKESSQISDVEKDLISSFPDIAGLAINSSQLYSRLEETTQKLKRANDHLKELDHLKDEFVSIASHELRTPMTAIKSYLWMSLNKPEQALNKQLTQYLNIAYTSTERLIKLVENMLTVSRIQGKRLKLAFESISIKEIIKQAYDELKIKADENKIHFKFTHPDQDLHIMGDKDKLREVIQNLAGNALKFTPSGGTIIINLEKKKDVVVVTVSDTGPGISQDDQKKLFHRFGWLGNSYAKAHDASGTGLGLYISKQIVTLHKGHITLESEPGKGSSFIVSLPLAK